MALLKNLYLDLGGINPFKKKKKPLSPPKPDVLRELPGVSKRLLEVQEEINGKKSLKTELPELVPNNIAQPPDILYNSQHNMPSEQQSDYFFKNLLKDLDKDQLQNKELVSKNLFQEMQIFWQDKKDGLFKSTLNNALKQDIASKIDELHQLEVEWQKLQLHHDKIKDELSSKEIILDTKIRQLKKTFSKINLNQNVKPEHEFVLADGKKLKNLQELADNLRIISDVTFSKHVNRHNNDFANWINDVMGMNELSHNISKLHQKEDIADFIEKYHRY